VRRIVKGAEPKSLQKYRYSLGASYDDYEDKQTLRESLVLEQRGICCYCMGRVVAGFDKMKIEHWQSQTRYRDRELDYSNLLGACLGGGKGTPPKQQYCDTRKGDSDLSRNPADPAHDVERVIMFDRDGTIRSTDPQFDAELNDVLNLNDGPYLKANRKATLDGFLDANSQRGDWDVRLLVK
jgi:uncharacterized protein (TIGR02646 family)